MGHTTGAPLVRSAWRTGALQPSMPCRRPQSCSTVCLCDHSISSGNDASRTPSRSADPQARFAPRSYREARARRRDPSQSSLWCALAGSLSNIEPSQATTPLCWGTSSERRGKISADGCCVLLRTVRERNSGPNSFCPRPRIWRFRTRHAAHVAVTVVAGKYSFSFSQLEPRP